MDQCHIRMCPRAVARNSDVTYVVCHRAEGVNGQVPVGNPTTVTS